MEKFTINGKVVEKQAVETFGSGFQKQVVVIDTAAEGSKYACPIPFTFKKDAVETQAAKLNVGDEVEVSFALDGRRWDKGDGTVKYFVDVTSLWVDVKKAAEQKTNESGDGKPITASSWKELVALAEAYGEPEHNVIARCKEYGKKFAEMRESDWKWIAAKILADHSSEGCDEDIPF